MAHTVKEMETVHVNDVVERIEVPEYFCKGWPVTKRIANLIAKASPTWVKIAVKFLVAVGDRLYADECQT